MNTANGTQTSLPSKLTFVDFCPETSSYSLKSLFSKTEVKYSHLLENVNEWLLHNAHYEAVRLETYFYNPLSKFGKDMVSGLYQSSDKCNLGIRVWIKTRDNTKKPIQKMKVLDVVPKIKIAGFSHSQFLENVQESSRKFSLCSPEFETMPELVDRLNATLEENEYIGQIVNIETLSLPVQSEKWSVDCEATTLTNSPRGVLNILRVHINERLFPQDSVEMIDFVPETETWNSPLAVPNVEVFTSVLRRASIALKARSDNYRIIGLSTLHSPTVPTDNQVNDKALIDPSQTYFTHQEWFKPIAFFCKYFRVMLAKPVRQAEANGSQEKGQKSMNCKVFISNKNEQQRYPSMPYLKDAIHQRFLHSDAQIISAETETILSTNTSASFSTLIDMCLQLRRYPCDVKLVFKVYVNDNTNKHSE